MNHKRGILNHTPLLRAIPSGLLGASLFITLNIHAQVLSVAVQHDHREDLFTKPTTLDTSTAAAPASGTISFPVATPNPVLVGADFSSQPPTEQKLHLVVGRSTFVNTKHRLTRVYVTSPSALDTYTASPNQIVVTARKAGTSSLVVWDEAGESQVFVVTADANVEALKFAIKQAMPNENVTVSASEGRVVLTGVTGTDKISEAAQKLASLYSKDVTNALLVNPSTIKQVMLKVRIVEVDRSKLNAFAVNLFNAGGSNYAGSSTGQASSSLTVTPGTSTTPKTITIENPLNFFLYSFGHNFGVTLQDLESLGCLQILSEPTITAMSGEKGSFLAGGEFPFPVVQGGSGGLTSITIQFRPYGVKLDFTPIVNADGTIQLKVSPEVSSLDYTNSVQISGYTIPALSTRKADTQVVLRSGETFAISGLLDKRTTDQYSNTPGISSVPVLGQLFKSKNVNHSAQELIVIVTPTIIDPLAEAPSVVEPRLPVPTLGIQRFDTNLPDPKSKK